MQKKTKFRYSIFFKLIILFIIFIVLVNISIGFMFSHILKKGPFGFSDRLPVLINNYIVKQIGMHPDTVRIRDITKELESNIRIETPDMKWSSDESIPDINYLSKDADFKTSENSFIIRQKGRPYYISKYKDGFIIITPVMPRDLVNETDVIIAVIIIFTLLASLLYFSLRWIFGPIRKLSDGVALISEGNFNNNIDIDRKDELGSLSDSINEMKDNISEMIKSKESLLIDVSHELRSPLTRIKLANEFIEDKKINSRIREDVKEMELMISELLDTYRMENINSVSNKEKTDLIKLVKGVVSKYDPQIVILNSDVNEFPVFAESRKMETVFNNIIDNAIKYSDGKPVNINIYRQSQDENIICVSIKDKGKGIDKNEIKKIFEPFYRIDKSREKKILGYGLGLSLVKKIIEEHKAQIEVKSTPGTGTEFIISIPIFIQNNP